MTTTAIEIFLIRREDAIAACLAVAEGRKLSSTTIIVQNLARQWLETMRDKTGNQRFLCLDCDAAFDRNASPDALMIALPILDQGQGVVSGLCPKCSSKPDLNHRILASLRHLWPDLTVAQSGQA